MIESEIDSFAGREVVMDVLTDYDNHSSVFSSIQTSQVIDRSENEADVLQVPSLFYPLHLLYLWTCCSYCVSCVPANSLDADR